MTEEPKKGDGIDEEGLLVQYGDMIELDQASLDHGILFVMGKHMEPFKLYITVHEGHLQYYRFVPVIPEDRKITHLHTQCMRPFPEPKKDPGFAVVNTPALVGPGGEKL